MIQQKSVKEQIELLIKLQVMDGEIYALETEKKDAPEKIKAIEDNLQTKKTGIKEAEENLKSLQVKLKEKEITLQQKEEQIKKLQGQLYLIKTNKEYTAMLTEVGGIKADNSIIEEEVIKMMDETDAGKKKIAEEKELFKKEEANAQKEKGVINNRVKEIDVRLSELFAKRENVTPGIEKQNLARYERVLKNKEGLGLVSIVDGACGGCHMNLPPQVISDTKLRENIITCGSCSRILYMDDNAEIN